MRRAVARQAYVGVITAWDMWRAYSDERIDAWEAQEDAIGLWNETAFLAGWRQELVARFPVKNKPAKLHTPDVAGRLHRS